MNQLLLSMETILDVLVTVCIYLMEFAGVVVLLVTGVKSFISWVHHEESMRLKLAQGISLALEFKMGGEVLRTVIVREWSELAILAAIIALRGLLAVLIHWEIKNEEKHLS